MLVLSFVWLQTFTYPPPEVLSVEPDPLLTALEGGDQRLTVTGTNFGQRVEALRSGGSRSLVAFPPKRALVLLSVLVGSAPCVDLVLLVPHTKLSCKAPSFPEQGTYNLVRGAIALAPCGSPCLSIALCRTGCGRYPARQQRLARARGTPFGLGGSAIGGSSRCFLAVKHSWMLCALQVVAAVAFILLIAFVLLAIFVGLQWKHKVGLDPRSDRVFAERSRFRSFARRARRSCASSSREP